jgi:hypothetical protein
MDDRANGLLASCLTQAMALARGWIPLWLTQVAVELYQRESSALHGREKHSLGHARTQLITHRDLLGRRFLEAIEADLRGVETASNAEPHRPLSDPRRLAPLSVNGWELLDDQQVQQTVDLARSLQIVRMACEEELAAFGARLSRAQGFDAVRIESNPLRPEAVVTALVRAIGTLNLAEDVRAHWLHAGAQGLGQSLEVFYQQLDQWLEHHGVAAAGYLVIQAPQSRAAPTAATALRIPDGIPASTASGRDPLPALARLHQLLAGQLAQNDTDASHAVARSLAGEVVVLLLRRITEDTRMLRAVRDLVQMLKEPLLQLAGSEPHFFADPQNPAGQLLAAITERSLAFSSEQDAGFECLLRDAMKAVRAVQAAGSQLSAQLPGALQRFNAAVTIAGVSAQDLDPQSPEHLVHRKLLAERVAKEIEAQPDFERAPDLVRGFLSGPWSQVIAHARLAAEAGETPNGADTPELRFMAVLPDLLWSSQLAPASRNRPRLIQGTPDLLRTLREGLDTIDHPQAQSEPLFQALQGLHEAGHSTKHLAQNGERAGFEAHDGQPRQGRNGEPEAGDSSFMTDADLLSPPDFTHTRTLTPDGQKPSATAADTLRVGAWIDLDEHGKTQRHQLTWASPNGRIFMFTASEGHTVSFSRFGLERLQGAGLLRVVAWHGAADDAPDSPARQARNNSAPP